MVAGDLLAQAAANTTGARRLAALIERTGPDRCTSAVKTLLSTTEKRLENALRTLEGRKGTFSDTLEWSEDGKDVDLTVSVSLEITEGKLIADFAGPSGQVAGPVNAPVFLTASCVIYVVKAMLDPEIPSNAGLFRRIVLATPERSIVNAAAPSPVALCTSITSQRITDALIGAFNQTRPEKPIAASTGSMNALILGGSNPATGRSYSYVETYAGGQGGLPGMAGASGVHCHMTNTANSPVELIEREYPLTVLDYSLIDGSGGAGEFSGGLGLRRTILVNADSVLTVHLDRTRHQPWGIMGGSPAHGSRISVSGADSERALAGKSTSRVRAGTTVTLETAGGGGWGTLAKGQ